MMSVEIRPVTETPGGRYVQRCFHQNLRDKEPSKGDRMSPGNRAEIHGCIDFVSEAKEPGVGFLDVSEVKMLAAQ